MVDGAFSETYKACGSNAVRLLPFFAGFNTDNIALVTKVAPYGMALTADALLYIKVSLTSVVVSVGAHEET
jgi:hypothetical protein